MKQLSLENLSVGYDGTAVQSGISIEIKSGDYLCIVGNNGAGKSTLIKTILGLIPPISGKISFENGLNSTDVGYLPQQTQIQKDFPASVWEVVLSGNINKHGFRFYYNKEEKKLAEEMLAKLGISDLKKRSYSRLSGGQQQRVLLARALCATRKILLLDEPSAGLDKTSTTEMYSTIKKLNDEGITIIMITHDIENSIKFSNHVLLIDKSAKLMQTGEYITATEVGQSE